jgi:hypothetical protein
MKQITNQQKKELFQVLIPYFESKPEDKWVVGKMHASGDCHCAMGFIIYDFTPYTSHFIRCLTAEKSGYNNLVAANDKSSYRHLLTPKQRVLAYLDDQVKSL